MGYRISNVSGSAGQRREVAAFLAAFVRGGGLRNPRPGDDEAGVWEQRMGWWWDQNPYCHEGAPLGFLLESEDRGIVGFNGLIPFEYEVDGQPIPTLVTTTFFVLEAHRSAVLGLVSRLRGLARTYQIIDGSPSPEMRRLLVRLGYRHAGDRAQYLFPTSRGGGAAGRSLLRAMGWSFPLPAAGSGVSCRVIRDPSEWAGTSAPPDGRIRPRTGPELLCWLTQSGTEKRHFFGLVDSAGAPLAHALGIYKKRFGIQSCLLVDYRDYRTGADHLALLIRRLLEDPDTGLDPGTAMIVLSRFGESGSHGAPGRKVDSILYYHLPPAWQNHEKVCLPVEGDLPLL